MARVLELYRTCVAVDGETTRAIRELTTTDGVQPAGFYVDEVDGRLWLLFTADDETAAQRLQQNAGKAGLTLRGAGLLCIPTSEESDAAMEEFFARR